MEKNKIYGIIAAAVILIAGYAYLNMGEKVLNYVLPISAICVLVMGGASAVSAKRSGLHGFAAYIPALCYCVLGAFIISAFIYRLI